MASPYTDIASTDEPVTEPSSPRSNDFRTKTVRLNHQSSLGSSTSFSQSNVEHTSTTERPSGPCGSDQTERQPCDTSEHGCQNDGPAKVHESKYNVSHRKHATITFQLPGVLPESDEIEQIWPDLLEMRKKGYAVAIHHAKNHASGGVSAALGADSTSNEDIAHNEQAKQPQRCADETGCHLLQPSGEDCYCQKRLKLALLEARVARLVNGAATLEDIVAIPETTNPSVPVDSMATLSTPRPHAVVHFEKVEYRKPSIYSTTTARSANITSFNPPTPYPKVYGELSENGLRVRIAQVQDEMRILNLALARRGSKGTDSEYSNSNVTTPASPEFHVGHDTLQLSSRSGAQQEYQ